MWFILALPDAKHPVQQEPAEEAEDDVRPRVPGIQLHERDGVQVQILVPTGTKSIRHLDTHICFRFCHSAKIR